MIGFRGLTVNNSVLRAVERSDFNLFTPERDIDISRTRIHTVIHQDCVSALRGIDRQLDRT